jgi:hypothetical protein
VVLWELAGTGEDANQAAGAAGQSDHCREGGEFVADDGGVGGL